MSFRAGDTVKIRERYISGIAYDYAEPWRHGTVICKFEDDTYLVRLSNDGYVLLPDYEIYGYSYTTFLSDFDRSQASIVFFGTGDLAVPMLTMLMERGYNVVAVVTGEDNPRHKKMGAVKKVALDWGRKVCQPQSLTDETFLKEIAALHPTLGVVVDFRLMPRELYGIPTFGSINLHTSLLPAYRGASPIQAAIRNGDHFSGLTTFVLNEGIDKGRVINNIAIYIDKETTAGELLGKMSHFGADLLDEAIAMRHLRYSTEEQSKLECDFIQPSYAPKYGKAECAVNWAMKAEEVCKFIRSLSPKPAAWTNCILFDKLLYLKIYRASVTDYPTESRRCGHMDSKGDELLIYCSDYAVSVEELLVGGGKRMTAKDFINGYGDFGLCE